MRILKACFVALPVLAFIGTSAQAQSPADTIKACYVRGSGTVYRVAAPRAPVDCTSNRDTPFLWNVIGPVGPQGATGLTGLAGPQGAAGAAGAQGPAGSQGATGAQGSAGADGAVGAQGPAGSQGATGAQGPAGADGAVGAQGPAGSQGATGAQGLPGAEGAVGAQGPAGPQGATGAQGPQGIPGASGYQIVQVNIGMPGGSPASPGQGTGAATCPAGKRVLGGGYRMESGGSADLSAVVALWDTPLDGGNGWFFIGVNKNPTTVGVYIYAICANVL